MGTHYAAYAAGYQISLLVSIGLFMLCVQVVKIDSPMIAGILSDPVKEGTVNVAVPESSEKPDPATTPDPTPPCGPDRWRLENPHSKAFIAA